MYFGFSDLERSPLGLFFGVYQYIPLTRNPIYEQCSHFIFVKKQYTTLHHNVQESRTKKCQNHYGGSRRIALAYACICSVQSPQVMWQ